MKKKIEAISIKTSVDCDVKAIISERLTKVLSEEIDKCSKEYFRNVDVSFTVEMD